ncbi:MAG: AAA-like domain-containing protein [Pegethrix bostrychoides GSE-TBD4-15B]|jgi:transcriptional regulator with XRE-family HTH domain|uniref:AAA-like domain-containing protein n=1 Tax=Pegethrix bostrychoides GSE-TBD4-15B TaxID=2839662 RepID=A0A951PBG2_9CYAN|nr:AAA-like domain-containing protein [Pegethrix bostrychoides GSE-TBD4-15B]
MSEPSNPKRKRGVLLSSQGWQRLQAAEHLAAIQQNEGRAYSLEQLSQQTQLSANTLTKVRRRQKPVDQLTLEAYFAAFDLSLSPNDYITQELPAATATQPAPFKGQLAIDSPFYIYRPPAEQLCLEAAMQPSALVRIKAARQFGKTSLVARMLSHAEDYSYRVVPLSLQLADSRILSDLDQFLRWLCVMVARSLGLPDELDQRWNGLFGGSYSCSDYFETYLLPAAERPLLLVLDEVNLLFNYPELGADFFGMLRAWYEQGRHSSDQNIWRLLRLVIVHSTEVYLPLNLHQSPFNVGLLIELPHFSPAQVQELASRYGLRCTEAEIAQIWELVGGHPYLTQLTLFHLAQPQPLAQIIETVTSPNSIFNSHLRQQFGRLEQDADLMTGMQQVIHSSGAILPPNQAFKLQGLGLVSFENQRAVPSCKLYRQYFTQVLPV